MRRVVIGKALGGLGQQRMANLLQRGVGARDGQIEILMQIQETLGGTSSTSSTSSDEAPWQAKTRSAVALCDRMGAPHDGGTM